MLERYVVLNLFAYKGLHLYGLKTRLPSYGPSSLIHLPCKILKYNCVHTQKPAGKIDLGYICMHFINTHFELCITHLYTFIYKIYDIANKLCVLYLNTVVLQIQYKYVLRRPF